MSADRSFDEEKVVSIFADALDVPPDDRGAFLDEACRDDLQLKDRVKTLLGALPAAEEYFGDNPLPDTMDASVSVPSPVSGRREGMVLGHYRLTRMLGVGGMGEVYLADDLALGRPAAVKLLRGGVDSHLRARFLKESAASARIEHPAVATFYEHGHDEGLDYLAMEYVPGLSLRDTLKDDPPEPIHTMALVSALLDGLVHAHAKGIIHRDIKPDNIVITPSGTPKLLDFGIAKEIHQPEARDEVFMTATMLTALTGHGFIVGTMGYMSPEQLRGDVVSEQTDLFAVGAVLYEMLAGEPAFPGLTGPQRMAATLSRELPVLEVTGISVDINAVLRRALARDCRDRYPNAAAFLRDLRDLQSGVALTVLPNTVAILDLENLAGREEDDWIGSGIAESLGADLGHQEGLELVPRNKVLRVATGHKVEDEAIDPVTIGLALGCRWVLSGTFQRMGPRIRLTVRFVEVATGSAQWVEKLDGEADDLFDMQDRLSRLVAGSLDLVMPEDDEKQQDLSVHELYSKGRKLLLTQQGTHLAVAQECMEKAVALDPEFAPALAGLAALQAPLGWYAAADPALLEGCEELAERAIASDPRFPESYVWLGYASWRKSRYSQAVAAFEKAERLDPSGHMPAYFLGCLYQETGDSELALAHMMRAARLAPDTIYVLSSLGYVHLVLDNFAESEWIFRRAIELVRGGDPFQWGGPMQLLVYCLIRQGKIEEAWQQCRDLLDEMEASSHAIRGFWRLGGLQLLAEIALVRGDREAARAAIGQAAALLEAQPKGPTKGHTMVQVLALRSVIQGDDADLHAAMELEKSRAGFDFSWGPRAFDDYTCYILAKAARHHGEEAMSVAYLDRARKAGCRLPFPGGDWALFTNPGSP